MKRNFEKNEILKFIPILTKYSTKIFHKIHMFKHMYYNLLIELNSKMYFRFFLVLKNFEN